jgi:DNA-binding transcriptional LysR family regulator
VYDIELTQLRRFIAVVEQGSFIEAAEKLNLTQQALSSSIARMEEMAGVRFLDRKRGGKQSLTLFGRLLLARGRTQIALAERMAAEIELLRDARGGSITIGIGETMTGRHVATAIRRYHRQQPDVQIRIVEGYTESMIDQLIAGEFDFICGGPSHDPERAALLDFHHLFEINDVLVVRKSHPLAGARELALRDLQDFTWMMPAFRGDIYEAIQVAHMRAKLPPPKRIIRSDAIIIGLWLCLDDDYIVTVSPDMVSPLIHLGGLVTLDLSETTILRHACLITRRDTKLSPAAHRMTEEIIFEAERTYGVNPTPRAFL